MSPHVLRRPAVTGWRLASPLAAHIGALAARLRRGGYSDTTIDHYVDALLLFNRWMRQHHPRAKRITGLHIEAILREQGTEGVVMHRDLRPALGHLRAVLVAQGVIQAPPAPTGPIAEELRGFDEHMRDVRGLASKTRRDRLRIVGKLLRGKFRKGPVDIGRIRPVDLRRFLTAELERVNSTSHATALAATLRGYFRYRASRGDPVGHLVSVILSPAHWSLDSLPRALSLESIKLVLASFTPELRSPLRGFAIVRIAADLGLRGGEIAQLRLDDIDWQAATLTIRRSKSGRASVLPLPSATGEAIADYLQHERPRTVHRAVFVRAAAPYDVPVTADSVRQQICRAFHRAGLGHGRSHALRHAFACRLIERGSSVKEVADLLRHRSLDTTLVYAKLDHRRLAEVGLPWPGCTS